VSSAWHHFSDISFATLGFCLIFYSCQNVGCLDLELYIGSCVLQWSEVIGGRLGTSKTVPSCRFRSHSQTVTIFVMPPPLFGSAECTMFSHHLSLSNVVSAISVACIDDFFSKLLSLVNLNRWAVWPSYMLQISFWRLFPEYLYAFSKYQRRQVLTM